MDRLSRAVRAMGVALALGVLVPTAAAAGPLDREHYSGTDSFDFADCGFNVHEDVTFEGVFMLKAPTRPGAPPRYFDNYSVVETLTANGKTITIEHEGLYKDLHATLVGGTIYQFTAIETGQPFVVRDASGGRIIFDRGRLMTTFQVDTQGDSDLSNDVFIDGTFELLADNGRHPGFYLDDLCEDIVVPLLG